MVHRIRKNATKWWLANEATDKEIKDWAFKKALSLAKHDMHARMLVAHRKKRDSRYHRWMKKASV